MRRRAIASTSLLALVCACAATRGGNPAQSTPPPAPPSAGAPAPELDALERFHHGSWTWAGTIKAGIAPDVGELAGTGAGSCRRVAGGHWFACDFNQTQSDGKTTSSWSVHWVAGWDGAARRYVAVAVDSYGWRTRYSGRIDGDRLVMDADEDLVLGGRKIRMRFVWDVSNPDHARWEQVRSVDGAPRELVEEYLCTPEPGPRP